MLSLLIAASLATAADKPPTYGEARRCGALIDAALSGEKDEARQKRLASASVWWSGIALELGPASGGTARQRVMLAIQDTDRAKEELASTDAAIRDRAVKELDACAARAEAAKQAA